MSNDPTADHECSKNIAAKQGITMNPNMPDVVIAVRVKGDNVGNDLTVSLDPQAKIPEAKRPNAKPIPIEDFPGITPAANPPPNKTRPTANKKRPLSRLPSKATSKATANIGIAVAARAAVVASVIACAIKRSSEPKPKPIPPIQKPLAQGSFRRTTFRSNIKIKKIITIKARKLRKEMSVIIPHVCKSWSAAGKPNANRKMAVAPKTLPRIFNRTHS